MSLFVERLKPHEWERWRAIRLRALQEAPYAFGSTFADASTRPVSHWQQHVVEFATFVVVAEGSDVGVARGAPHPVRADLRELISMWVAPSDRRRGVGSRLIGAVAEWAVAQGATGLLLDVREGNGAAVALYARHGFELVEGDSLGEHAPGELRMLKAIGHSRRA